MNDDSELTGKDIDNLNGFIFKWINRTIEFDTLRSLQLNTFLLNYFLAQNYLPAIEIVKQRFCIENYTAQQLRETENFRKYVERIHGIYIMIPMTFKHSKKVSKFETDNRIAGLDAYGDYVNAFFMINTNPDFFTHLSQNLMKSEYEAQEYWLPYLNFDPEFQKILESDAIKCISFFLL